MTVRSPNRRAPLCLGVALFASAGLLGCQNDSGGASARARADTSRRAGAQMETASRPRGVPANARMLGQGSEQVRVTAPTDGTLYVYDATDRRVIWSGPSRAQANVVIDPAADAVTINDQQVSAHIDPQREQRTDLDPSHQYQLWYVGTGR